MYKRIINIDTISKFKYQILDKKGKISDNYISINTFFWQEIFSLEFLIPFFEKYNKKFSNIEKYNYENDFNFIINKLKVAKIFNLEKQGVEYIVFSYMLYSRILFFINKYYFDDKISISLSEGFNFNINLKSFDDLISKIEFFSKKNIIKDFLNNVIEYNFDSKNNNIYRIQIFWPQEFIIAGIISNILKKRNSSTKIIIDLSSGNEQFDFTQWVDYLLNVDKTFFNYYDFIIVNRDFGDAIDKISLYLNGKIKSEDLKNTIFYDNKIIYNKLVQEDLNINILDEFIKNTFFDKGAYKFIAKRFLPYKCYWSKCNFCAINSNNKFKYDDKYSYDFFIDKWIEYIRNYDIKFINFLDEAIPPRVIIKFAEKIIENKLSLKYQIRTRFERLYNKKNCLILAKSGCRFCGIGLESAVDRVNEEIGNKGNFGITLRDKLKIIHNFDSAGVSFHNYSIMGFPTETTKESLITYNFLKTNIINSNFYTCTPNIFGLMKGPKIFEEREKYGIKINEDDLNNPFNLIFNFTSNIQRDNKILNKLVDKLHKIQFLPWLINHNNISGKGFWNYIDRSYIFYILKKIYKKNPFYSYMNINKDILSDSFSNIKKGFFEISNFLQFFSGNNNEFIIYDWVGDKNITLDVNYKNLFLNYNININLEDNLNNIGITKNDNTLEKNIRLLLENNILIIKK